MPLSRRMMDLEALLQANGEETRFKAMLERHGGEKIELADRQAAEKVIEELRVASFVVERIKKSRRQRRPAPPFTTSTLQQEASSRLGFTGRKTMALAQQLYEGISLGGGEITGLITYMRTDSTRVSAQAQAEARELIARQYGEEYLPPQPPQYRSRKGAQEAHEAIRPTSLSHTPQAVAPYLTKDQARLYKLIWERFVASQMAPAIYDQVRVDISAGEYGFKAAGSSLIFPGFLKAYHAADKEEEETILPPLQEGQQLQLVEFLPQQHFTQPPPRYNDASLIKILEEKGIGRPSTYVPIIETLLQRGYVVRENKAFVPTELGFIVVDLMKRHFPEIIDVDFTARMEERLDLIEEVRWIGTWSCMNSTTPSSSSSRRRSRRWRRLRWRRRSARRNAPLRPEPRVQHGRFGQFLACPGYPECRYTKILSARRASPAPWTAACWWSGAATRGGSFTAAATTPGAPSRFGISRFRKNAPAAGASWCRAGGAEAAGSAAPTGNAATRLTACRKPRWSGRTILTPLPSSGINLIK